MNNGVRDPSEVDSKESPARVDMVEMKLTNSSYKSKILPSKALHINGLTPQVHDHMGDNPESEANVSQGSHRGSVMNKYRLITPNAGK